MTRLVCVSDTHLSHEQGSSVLPAFTVPPGDVFVHAGDMTWSGTLDEIVRAMKWILRLPHPHKVIIAGNHDRLFERNNALARSLVPESIVYLEDQPVEVMGLSFYGSPWTPRFLNWAFNLDRGGPLREKWAMIPHKLDVLVTHGPPYGVLDEVPVEPKHGLWEPGSRLKEHVGCGELRKVVMDKARPKLHLFGHIHCSRGVHKTGHTVFVNAAIVDDMCEPRAHAVVVDFSPEPDDSFAASYPMCPYVWIKKLDSEGPPV